jgi:hypothetical protein
MNGFMSFSENNSTLKIDGSEQFASKVRLHINSFIIGINCDHCHALKGWTTLIKRNGITSKEQKLLQRNHLTED